MKPKIVDILAKILEGLSNNRSIEDINHYLMESKKYDNHTLGIAFSLLYDKILKNKLYDSQKKLEQSKSLRFLTDDEKIILGPENYNYIMHLMNVGLVTYDILETILEQITLFPDNSITQKEINWMVLFSIVDFDSDVPHGSRVLLYTSDSVN